MKTVETESVTCRREGCSNRFDRVVGKRGPKQIYCKDDFCKRERQNERQAESRAARTKHYRVRENHWDPVAQREIIAKHGRQKQHEEFREAAAARNARKRAGARAEEALAEVVECGTCISTFFETGERTACAAHRGAAASAAAYAKNWAPFGVDRGEYDAYVAALESAARIRSAKQSREAMAKVVPPSPAAPVIELPVPADAEEMRAAA